MPSPQSTYPTTAPGPFASRQDGRCRSLRIAGKHELGATYTGKPVDELGAKLLSPRIEVAHQVAPVWLQDGGTQIAQSKEQTGRLFGYRGWIDSDLGPDALAKKAPVELLHNALVANSASTSSSNFLPPVFRRLAECPYHRLFNTLRVAHPF